MQRIEDFLDWSAIYEEQELSMREPEQCAGLDVGLPLMQMLVYQVQEIQDGRQSS